MSEAALKTAIKYLLTIAGTISLVLGIIGIFAPILPTTPFLLLSAVCYMRSSNRLYNWLIKHKVFGVYISNYIKYKAIRKNIRIIALAFLWLSLGLSIYIIDSIHFRILLFAVGIGVSIHLCLLKTMDSIIQNVSCYSENKADD